VQLSAFIDENIVEWLDTTVGEDSRHLAMAYGLPFHVVREIKTKHTGYMEAQVVNDYQKDGVPIGVFLNNGTKAHDIWGNPLLSFNWLGRHWVLPHVYHPGTEGYHYMEGGHRTGMVTFKKLLDSNIRDFRNWGDWQNELL